MAYLTYTSLNDHVSEQRYCVSRDIAFTTLTSCIVVVGKSSSYFNQVVGAHLVVFTSTGVFDDDAANEVIEVFAGCTGRTYILGNIDCWSGQPGGVGTAYANVLASLSNCSVVNTGGATITATVQGGQVRYKSNGVLGAA
ncbi:MAG: hypothetical protein KUG77_25880 [Nannocystaceae bacterium]|nr:hypothetical protein [Nannocystaceae bacterium]